MRQLRLIILVLFIITLGTGCSHDVTEPDWSAVESQQRLFILETISPERGRAYLSQLGLDAVCSQSDPNGLLVTCSSENMHKARIVLELVDGEEEYVIEILAPVSAVRDLPTNKQITDAVGDMTIGTFADPPVSSELPRAIIDIHADLVVAVMPARFQQEIVTLVESGLEGLEPIRPPTSSCDRVDDANSVSDEKLTIEHAVAPETAVRFDANSPAAAPVIPADRPAPFDSGQLPTEPPELAESTLKAGVKSQAQPRAVVTQGTRVDESDTDLRGNRSSTADALAQSRTITPDITVPSSAGVTAPATSDSTYRLPTLDNADQTLVLNLPEELDLILLLDLAAEYLHLDYMYDRPKLQGQMVTLKLRGKLQGEITVKELYPLLESILKFKGFVMTRHEGNFVTVVPVEEALEVDPMLVDPNDRRLKAGNMVVTRMFELKHVDTFSAVNLLENMRLTVAVSPVRETQTLIVTSYAHRMARVERLLAMIDRPGKLRKVRFRQLQYITANMLAEKVKTLATELQTAGVTIAQSPQTSPQPQGPLPQPSPTQRRASWPGSGTALDRQTVYLDADDRTNRILIIGYEEQLVTIEELVNAFDVPQQGLRVFQVYELKQVEAGEVRDKLQELGVIAKPVSTRETSPTPPQPTPSPLFAAETSPSPGGPLVEEPRVVALEATNALLVNATREQHAQIAEIIAYVDKVQQDLRMLKVYEIDYIEAEDARRKLVQLQLCEAEDRTSDFQQENPSQTPATATKPASSPQSPNSEKRDLQTRNLFRKPQVVLVESTNSLLVNATPEQHAQIETVLAHVDAKTLEDKIPYQVYPLENSSPSHLAEILESLIQETVAEDKQDKEGKVQRVARKKQEEDIAIVPDPNTYSLIVYASKKNQEWIASLVQQLDKRRPQVLIDATLVEITKADAFSYDLSLLRSSDNLDSTSGITGVGVDPNVLGKFIEWGSGALSAFYGDKEIQSLLTAMQSKSYGRVLAKPKLLVNDNEAGTIKTTDTTYVQTKSGIPVSSGAVGPDQNFVETSVSYEPYEAGITLDITPHISEGDLLRLEIVLTRSDFLQTNPDKPPDTRSNEVDTAVTLPNGSTVILGGLLKMNQVKGGSKVPILGDIPLIGGLFRSVNNEDTQSKLYVFVKAEIIRPAETVTHGMKGLEAISERNQTAFEKHEEEFQSYANWPGIKPKPVKPPKVLDAQ